MSHRLVGQKVKADERYDRQDSHEKRYNRHKEIFFER